MVMLRWGMIASFSRAIRKLLYELLYSRKVGKLANEWYFAKLKSSKCLHPIQTSLNNNKFAKLISHNHITVTLATKVFSHLTPLLYSIPNSNDSHVRLKHFRRLLHCSKDVSILIYLISCLIFKSRSTWFSRSLYIFTKLSRTSPRLYKIFEACKVSQHS